MGTRIYHAKANPNMDADINGIRTEINVPYVPLTFGGGGGRWCEGGGRGGQNYLVAGHVITGNWKIISN